MQPGVNAPAPPTQQPKKPWSRPAIVVLPLTGARGAVPGAKCDKYGSLSVGTGCPR